MIGVRTAEGDRVRSETAAKIQALDSMGLEDRLEQIQRLREEISSSVFFKRYDPSPELDKKHVAAVDGLKTFDDLLGKVRDLEANIDKWETIDAINLLMGASNFLKKSKSGRSGMASGKVRTVYEALQDRDLAELRKVAAHAKALPAHLRSEVVREITRTFGSNPIRAVKAETVSLCASISEKTSSDLALIDHINLAIANIRDGASAGAKASDVYAIQEEIVSSQLSVHDKETLKCHAEEVFSRIAEKQGTPLLARLSTFQDLKLLEREKLIEDIERRLVQLTFAASLPPLIAALKRAKKSYAKLLSDTNDVWRKYDALKEISPDDFAQIRAVAADLLTRLKRLHPSDKAELERDVIARDNAARQKEGDLLGVFLLATAETPMSKRDEAIAELRKRVVKSAYWSNNEGLKKQIDAEVNRLEGERAFVANVVKRLTAMGEASSLETDNALSILSGLQAEIRRSSLHLADKAICSLPVSEFTMALPGLDKLSTSLGAQIAEQAKIIAEVERDWEGLTFVSRWPIFRNNLDFAHAKHAEMMERADQARKLQDILRNLPSDAFADIKFHCKRITEVAGLLHPADGAPMAQDALGRDLAARRMEHAAISGMLSIIDETPLSKRQTAIENGLATLAVSPYWSGAEEFSSRLTQAVERLESERQLTKSVNARLAELKKGTARDFDAADKLSNLFVLEAKIQWSSLTDPDKEAIRSEISAAAMAVSPAKKLSSAEIDLDSFVEFGSLCLAMGPNTQFRPQQYQFALACYEALFSSRDIVVEGPTGLGKTRGLLAAVLPWLAADENRRALYITRTGTQVANVVREIKEIREAAGAKLGWLTATLHGGIERVQSGANCFKPIENAENQKCSSCALSKGRQIPNYNGLPNDYVLDFELLAELSAEGNLCANRLVLAATNEARIVVAPHSFIGDEGWKTAYGLSGSAESVIVVDEGHNFVADASGKPFMTIHWGDTFTQEDKSDLKNRVYNLTEMAAASPPWALLKIDENDTLDGSDFDEAVSLYHALISRFRSFSSNLQDFVGFRSRSLQLQGKVFIEDATDFLTIAKELLHELGLGAFAEHLRRQSQGTLEAVARDAPAGIKPVADFIFNIVSLADRLRIFTSSPTDFYALASLSSIELYSIPPKHEIAQTLNGYSSRIFTSATIRPVEMIAEIAGLKKPLAIEIPHVFPPENYKTFYVAGFHSGEKVSGNGAETSFSAKQKNVLRDLLGSALASAAGRNVGVFVNNVRNIPSVCSVIREILDSEDFILGFIPGRREGKEAADTQGFFNDEFKRATGFIRDEEIEIRRAPQDVAFAQLFIDLGMSGQRRGRTAVLIGVQGGTLAEGIDYRGPAMEMVINVGLPYPVAQEDQIKELKENYWADGTGDRGLAQDLAFRQDAFRKLAQTVGRAHRTPTDRAVVIFADERLLAVKEEDGEYRGISATAALRNRLILQDPVQPTRGNIVLALPNAHRKREVKDVVKRQWSSIAALADDDFLNLTDMETEIRKFFEEPDNARHLSAD